MLMGGKLHLVQGTRVGPQPAQVPRRDAAPNVTGHWFYDTIAV